MTKNQLEYQKNAETQRHNEAMERFEKQSLLISDKQASASLTSAGAAAAQAQVAAMRAAEESRHNLANESIARNRMYMDAWGTAVDTAKVAATFAATGG